MNRRACTGIFAAVVCLTFGLLTGCSNSSSKSAPTIAITATSGTPQSGVSVGTAFVALSATVTSNGTPASGVSVTFTAPASGASCAFPGGAIESDTTNSSGVATSSACTANNNAGAFTVAATTSGASSPANFSLTSAAIVTSASYVFYVSGEEAANANNGGQIDYYAIVGALTVDSNGNVLGGEEDYNDAFGVTSPNEPSPDTIAAGGTLAVDPTTGLGTLTITSSYTKTGVSGKQEFAVLFVNPGHALITQFDGSATSSGSLDLQSATAITGGNYSFAMSGIDDTAGLYASWDFGGVFTTGTGAGIVDINDDGTVSTGNAFTSTSGSPDAFGRNVVSISTPAIALATYPVGPEVLRMIDVNTTDAAVGSAYGQGVATFDDTSLTAGVFAEIGQWSTTYATVGQFTTDTAGNITAGLADDNELDNAVQLSGNNIAGSTYDLVSSGVNGYGSMTLTGNGDISSLGVYMVDPALNINDPNNTSADVGGALFVDLDSSVPGGMGVITPQSDTTAADFSGSYAAGFQDFNYFENVNPCTDCEFDMVGPFTMVSDGALSTASIGADDSDPLGTISGVESNDDTYGSAPLSVSPGYFTMQDTNGTANPLTATVDGLAGAFNVDIFQASATTLYWINIDTSDVTVFLGTLQAQSSVAKVHAAHRRATRSQPQKKTTKTTFGANLR
jgi:hypothetical protein